MIKHRKNMEESNKGACKLLKSICLRNPEQKSILTANIRQGGKLRNPEQKSILTANIRQGGKLRNPEEYFDCKHQTRRENLKGKMGMEGGVGWSGLID
jgi:hypothetical protein